MDPTPENFDKLRQLLALKGREQPPPGFFDCFAAQVRTRLGEPPRCAPESWWQRLVGSLDARPMLAGAYGLAVGGVLLLAVNYLVKPEPTPGFTQQPPLPARDLVPALAPREVSFMPVATNLAATSNATPPGFLTNPGTGTGISVMPASTTNRP